MRKIWVMAGLVLIFALGFFGYARFRAAHRVRLLIPMYQYPGPGWLGVEASAKTHPLVIVNPASGPGNKPDVAFQLAIQALQGKGIGVLGYVASQWGQVPLAVMEREIRHWKIWYHVDGIFVDSASAQCSPALNRYYRSLSRYIRAQMGSGAWTVINPGVPPGACLAKDWRVLVVYEGSGQPFPFSPKAWMRTLPADRFAAILYRMPATGFFSRIQTAQAAHFGWIFLTDLGTLAHPNAYDRLPSNFTREVAAIARANRLGSEIQAEFH